MKRLKDGRGENGLTQGDIFECTLAELKLKIESIFLGKKAQNLKSALI